MFLKSYGFLPLAKSVGKNVSDKYSQELFDSVKKLAATRIATDVLKTLSKREIQKTTEATGQGATETPSNLALEGVTFNRIVPSSDIFGKFFDVKFFALEDVISPIPLSGIYRNTHILLLVNSVLILSDSHPANLQ